MAPRKTTTKAKAKGNGPVAVKSRGKAPVVIPSSNDDADNILTKPAFKAAKTGARKSTSSFDRNIQKLLEMQKQLPSPVAESSAMAAGASEPADETNDAMARQLKTLDKLLKEVTQLRHSILSREDQVIMLGAVHSIDMTSDAINDTVNEIADTLETTSAGVASMEAIMDGIDTQTDTINDTTCDIKDTVTEINDTVDEIKDDLKDVPETVDEIRDTLIVIQETVDETSTKVDTVEEALAIHENVSAARYRSLDHSMDMMGKKLDALIDMVRAQSHVCRHYR
ncbi:uncharacterized protein RCC_01605 [Ramularia collo-cygni]|uniref:Uncharacterized protein n=1 Tax=Ramularia collo-cygni TaxID=112498 RepID=A0A2D3UMV6_9PEZI|nr:uncharacterized protein RCC_01605 [Ramularia collo-cygni]CZT15771.1 uncharacterized protein RCC_01605 [Ramularia collo-cygni]